MRNIIKKVLYASIIIVMCFSTGINHVTAQGDIPAKPERLSKADISLSEVESYYGRLADRTGPIKVVVELTEMAGIQYQVGLDAQNGLQFVRESKAQLDRVQQSQQSFMQNAASAGITVTEIYRVQRVYNGVALVVDSQQLQALAQLKGVKAVYPLISKTIDHTTSVPLINAPEVWGGVDAYQGDGVKIGVIDTGIDYMHTNFGGPGTGYASQDFTSIGESGGVFPSMKVVGGYDFAGDDYDAGGDLGSVVPSPDPDPMDCNGHGSHVSGSAAGYGVNKDGTTYTGDYATLKNLTSNAYLNLFRIGPGVAPKASLYALRVFGCNGSTDLTDMAVEWAVDPNGDGDYSDHLDVINLSLGSSYGSEYDTSSMAVNNAVLAGVVVVASAGNSADINYITGAPGAARYAISVANTTDSGSVTGAFIINTPSAIAGNYPATEAEFGPDLADTGPVTGDVVVAIPATGCSALTNAGAVSGKIALIDRGGCTFATKAQVADNAGAIGVLIANNAAGDPITMGGDDTGITIPSMMTTQAVGTAIKANLPVNITLTAALRNTIVLVNDAQTDKVVASSSRGLRRGDSGLKPDISAPGDTIFSTATGTGNQGVSYGGTSMASPHVAGVMALLREEYPGWSVEELKALVMNTATHDLFTGDNQTGMPYAPSRVGAGRVDALNASTSQDVIAFNKADPGVVSISYGSLEVVDRYLGVDETFNQWVTVENKGSASVSYEASMALAPSYPVNPGVTFTLLDAAGLALPDPLVVAAGSSVDMMVSLEIDAELLVRGRDATMAASDSGLPRDFITETGGYLILKPTSGQTLRVPVHAAPRPASDLRSSVSQMKLPAAQDGSFLLNMTGTGVHTMDDYAAVSAFELKDKSPNDAWSMGINNNADLQYVGVMSDLPLYEATTGMADTSVYFGISTYGEWSTPAEVEMDVYIDADKDGDPDHVVFNYTLALLTGTDSDVFVTYFCSYPDTSDCDFWYYTNIFTPSDNTNIFNSSVMVLPVSAEGIGLTDTNTDFNFMVVTFDRESEGIVDSTDWLSYDTGKMVVDTNDAATTASPAWFVTEGDDIEVGYNKANITADNMPLGLLLLYHHNVTGQQAEVVDFEYQSIALMPEMPTIQSFNNNMAEMMMLLDNTTDTNCTFDLTYASSKGWDVVGPDARYVPANAQDEFAVQVNVPGTAHLGDKDTITVNAMCREDASIKTSATFELTVGGVNYFPIINR